MAVNRTPISQGNIRSAQQHVFGTTAPILIQNGYVPLPIIPPHANAPNPGKRPWLTRWQELSPEKLSRLASSAEYLNASIGVRCDNIVVIDVDTDHADIKRAIWRCIRHYNLICKIGRKGGSVFFRKPNDMPNLGRIGFDYARPPAGQARRFLDIFSGPGAQVVIPPSLHPDTNKPYRWVGKNTLLSTPLHELPPWHPDDLDRISNAVAHWTQAPRQNYAYAFEQTTTPSSIADTDPQNIKRLQAYCRKVLQIRCAELAAKQEGEGRNQFAFDTVCRLGCFVHHGILPEQELRSELTESYEACGAAHDHGPRQLPATIGWALNASRDDPFPWLAERKTTQKIELNNANRVNKPDVANILHQRKALKS